MSELVLSPFQNTAHLMGQKNSIHNILKILNNHISKTKYRKNWKLDFSFVSDYCALLPKRIDSF